ncbi:MULTISPECIES: MFS transporter [unclassified Streptomyces]|uniref:MFS transporter n=1 Tax=unclassified Streptomyces TaxID=2593676 RepID=UPI00224FDCB6|nr:MULTISPECIES: MFS transporter [unclassified Streptomyces]WSP53038.1 MFS transporter [Streptomyces sp. NBC_01241]WSU19635.1 MFS transporter [Streptomyces sp. NBC_01108]MCX4800047.1 MFS transporter [Streptomyces sp. NBC_01242]WSJ40764.1 MFS transporter [Streptomyces sp. NBC_01321]WSP59813.1 MFS transporter [Streptomyces sp. NBC_01241]
MSSPSAPTGAPAAELNPRRWAMLAVALVAMFMAIFDFYVINIATPSLQSQLNIGEATLELIIGGYTFTYASLLVASGRWGDIFSYKRMFMIGMGLFTVASLFCGIAQTGSQLVVVRLIQGVGAALMVPQVVAFITVTFPPPERPKALSWFGATIGLAVVAAQILGGVLLSADVASLGWRVIFLINIPIGLVTMLLAAKLLPNARAARKPKQDVIGNIGISITLGLAILPVVLGRSEGWPVWGWIMLGLSVPFAIGTVMYEKALLAKGGEPMLNLSLFQNKSYGVGILIIVGVMTFYSGFIFGMTMFLQFGLGLSPLRAGLTFGPMGLGFALSSLMARPMLMKYGVKVITIGQVLLVLSTVVLLFQLNFSGTDTSAWEMVVPMVLGGLGTGVTLPALTGVVMSKVAPQQAGVASGLLSTAQQFANTIGVAVFGVFFFNALGSGPTKGDYVQGLEVVGWYGIGLSLLTLAATFLLPRGPMGPPPGARPPAGAPAVDAQAQATPSVGAKAGGQ